jgi:hypothetical protein
MGNALAVASSSTQHIGQSFAVVAVAMKPQLAMNAVHWTRYLSFFSIYRHILNIRTIYVRIHTIYKHIRLSTIVYVCVRIRTYSVRILRTYMSVYFVYVRIPCTKTRWDAHTNIYRPIQMYTDIYERIIRTYTCIYVQYTYVFGW